MKRRTLLLFLAALAAVFALLVAIDVISFDTARADRWVAVLGFAAAAVLVVVATVGSRSEPAASVPEDLDEERSSSTPSTPEPELAAPEAEAVASSAESAERPTIAEPKTPGPALPTRPTSASARADTLEVDLEELVDDDEMNEIAALVSESNGHRPEQDNVEGQKAAQRDDEQAIIQGVADTAIESLSAGIVSTTDEPLARIELRLADYDDEALQRLVKESERLVIAEMVRTGQLTSAGGLTEKDIASMIFLAYNSDEMLAELRLRKSLDQPGEVAVTDKDLAPLRNIE